MKSTTFLTILVSVITICENTAIAHQKKVRAPPVHTRPPHHVRHPHHKNPKVPPLPQPQPSPIIPGPAPPAQPPPAPVNPVNQPILQQQQPTVKTDSDDTSEEIGDGTNPNSKKTFQQINIKFEWKTELVQEKQGEIAPSDEVKQIVQKHASQIKNRAQLPVITDEDRADLNAASCDALSYIHFSNGEDEIYLIKVIIGNQYIVHVKVAAKRIQASGGTFKPDVEQSVVMLVLPDKEEQDKLSKEEFENTSPVIEA